MLPEKNLISESSSLNESATSEPAPTAAEPAPTAAREKVQQGILSGIDLGRAFKTGDQVSVSSGDAFEFVAGTVHVNHAQTELIVTWDIRGWLRIMFADPLGIPEALPVEPVFSAKPGFNDAHDSFSVICR